MATTARVECVRACVRACVRTCLHACLYAGLHTCPHTHMSMYMIIHMPIHMSVQMSAHMSAHICAQMPTETLAQDDGEGTRGAGEAWDDGAAAFNDGESPYCLAHRLCRARFASIDSGRALLASGVMGMRGGRGEGAPRPDGDTW